MEISEDVLEFLNREDVRYALRSNDMQELYKLTIDGFLQVDLSTGDIGELTSLLMQAGVDPLRGMTEIPAYFLYRQRDIKSFSIPTRITKIGNGAFTLTGLESITIPNSVREIDNGAFYGCKNLKTVKLPIGVELNGDAFNHSSLESIELRDVKLQSPSIFEYCEQLKSVIIKGDTPTIPDWTFHGCTNLTHVELPAGLKKIGSSIFSGCSSLREIDFAGTVDQWKEVQMRKSDAELFFPKIICSNGILKYDKTMEEWKQV